MAKNVSKNLDKILKDKNGVRFVLESKMHNKSFKVGEQRIYYIGSFLNKAKAEQLKREVEWGYHPVKMVEGKFKGKSVYRLFY